MTDEDCKSVISRGHELTRDSIDAPEISNENLGKLDEQTRQKIVGCIKEKLKSEEYVDASMFVKFLAGLAMSEVSQQLSKTLFSRSTGTCMLAKNSTTTLERDHKQDNSRI